MNHLPRLAPRRSLRGRGDAGYSTEAVIVIALLAVMAIGAVGLISAEVMESAKSFSLD